MNRLRPKIARTLYTLAMRIYPHLEADRSLAKQVDKTLNSTVLKNRIYTFESDMWPEEAVTITPTPPNQTIIKGYEKS